MEDIHEMTSIDPWFLDQLRQVVATGGGHLVKRVIAKSVSQAEIFSRAKRSGDIGLADWLTYGRFRN